MPDETIRNLAEQIRDDYRSARNERYPLVIEIATLESAERIIALLDASPRTHIPTGQDRWVDGPHRLVLDPEPK